MSDVNLIGSFGPKNRWQKKVLSADVTATTLDISTTTGNSDFKFTGLEIGKHYEIYVASLLIATLGDHQLDLFTVHDGQDILRNYGGNPMDSGGSGDGKTISNRLIFKATASTLTFKLSSVGSGSILVSTWTHAILIERNDLEDEVSIW